MLEYLETEDREAARQSLLHPSVQCGLLSVLSGQ